MTKAQIISDVILQLTQSDPSDDLALDERQIAAWLSYHANALVANEINTKLAKSEAIPAIYITREECLIGELEDTDCGGECEDRISVTLTGDVLVLNNQAGVILVETEDGDQIKKGSVETRANFKQVRFSKPSVDNPLYYLQGENKIYIEGFDDSNIEFDKINVFYVKKRDYIAAADSDEVVVSDLVLPQLIDSIVQRGKLEMYGTQADVENDGTDPKSTVYHTAISNPENNG